MVVSGVLQLYGGRTQSTRGNNLGVIPYEQQISNTTTRAGGEKSAEQWTWARQALYLSYSVWIFSSEHPEKEGVIVPILQ